MDSIIMSQKAGKNFYNKTGFFFFLATMGASCLWGLYFLIIKNSIDLGEYKDLPKTPSSPTLALSEEEKARPWHLSDNLMAHGAQVYKAQCALCHGPKGLGDGTPGLIPPPRNLVEGKWTKGGSSKAMFITLQKGIEGSSMVSFKHLPKIDRWAVIHYVRSLTQNKVPDNEKELEEFATQL